MNNKRKWSTDEVIKARQTPIKPLLEKLGYKFMEFYGDNWSLLGTTKTIIVKKHYWRNPEAQTGGNAIDLLTQHLGYTFTEAMELLINQLD
jgi:hypothetical protein